MNEKEPIHSHEDPFEEGEIRYHFYSGDGHIIIHYMESLSNKCGYTDPVYSPGDSGGVNINPMEQGSSIYGVSHDEKVAKLINCAYTVTEDANELCAHKEECTCHWMINWDMD